MLVNNLLHKKSIIKIKPKLVDPLNRNITIHAYNFKVGERVLTKDVEHCLGAEIQIKVANPSEPKNDKAKRLNTVQHSVYEFCRIIEGDVKPEDLPRKYFYTMGKLY